MTLLRFVPASGNSSTSSANPASMPTTAGSGLHVDEHPLRGVLGRGRGLGDDHGHRLPHEAHPAGGQPRPGHGRGGPGAAGPRKLEVQVLGGEDADHAGPLPGLVGVDPQQLSVGEPGADEGQVHCALDQGVAQVGEEGPPAEEQPRVLDAPDTVAEDAHRPRLTGSAPWPAPGG